MKAPADEEKEGGASVPLWEILLGGVPFVTLVASKIDVPEIWYDEAWRWLAADPRRSYTEAMAPWFMYGAPFPVSFPYLTALYLARTASLPISAVRWIHVAAALFILWGTRVLGGRLGGRWVGRAAALLLIANSNFGALALELKEHIWLGVSTLCLALLVERRFARGEPLGAKEAVALLVSAAISPWVVFSFAALGGLLLLSYLRGRRFKDDAVFLLAGALPAVAWIATVVVGNLRATSAVETYLRESCGTPYHLRNPLFLDLPRMSREIREFLGLMTGPRGTNIIALPLLTALLGTALVRLRKAAAGGRAVAWMVGLCYAIAAAIHIFYGLFYVRFLAFSLPFLYIVISSAIRLPAPRWVPVVLAGFVATTALGWPGLYRRDTFRSGYLDAIAYIRRISRGETVVHLPGYTYPPFLVYAPDLPNRTLDIRCMVGFDTAFSGPVERLVPPSPWRPVRGETVVVVSWAGGFERYRPRLLQESGGKVGDHAAFANIGVVRIIPATE